MFSNNALNVNGYSFFKSFIGRRILARSTSEATSRRFPGVGDSAAASPTSGSGNLVAPSTSLVIPLLSPMPSHAKGRLKRKTLQLLLKKYGYVHENPRRTLPRGDQTFPGDEDYTQDDYYASLLSEDMSDFDEDLYLERMNRIKQG